jgi:hypothetical protein
MGTALAQPTFWDGRASSDEQDAGLEPAEWCFGGMQRPMTQAHRNGIACRQATNVDLGKPLRCHLRDRESHGSMVATCAEVLTR